jgi:hypothetical protein
MFRRHQEATNQDHHALLTGCVLHKGDNLNDLGVTIHKLHITLVKAYAGHGKMLVLYNDLIFFRYSILEAICRMS